MVLHHLLLVASAFLLRVAEASYAPNHFLGTCLSEAWVSEKKAELGVSSTARNTDGRLTYPFLQRALQYPRYTVCPLEATSG
jgi:hypothetical protein